jgi:hypothetical protein
MCVVETNVWNASITHRRDAAQAIEALAAYSVQRGHDAASFGDSADRRSLILAPHDGRTRSAEAGRLSFSTGFVRPWLKLIRGAKTSFAISPPVAG